MSDMAESGIYRGLAECGLQPNFKRQTGPIFQADPNSCMSKDTSAGFHLATYLDSDSDDDILNIRELETGETVNSSEYFINPPWRRVSKRIDGDDIVILTQVNRKIAMQVYMVLHEMAINDIIAFIALWPQGKFREVENYISVSWVWSAIHTGWWTTEHFLRQTGWGLLLTINGRLPFGDTKESLLHAQFPNHSET